MFSHLHVHSFYSLMDGLNSPQELCQAAKEQGQQAIALTDHGTLAGHRELQKGAKDVGIKPILGLEAYISPTDRFDRRPVAKRHDNTNLYNHIVLLAKDADGLRNLNRLSELAWREGFYMKPRIDKDLLSEYGQGLIVLSGCLNGLISKAIERDDHDAAAQWVDFFKARFGDDFYIEVQAHNPYEINFGLLKLADSKGIRAVATGDCHYAWEGDLEVEEALLILQTGGKHDKDWSYDTTRHMDSLERFNKLYPERPISFADFELFVNSEDRLRKAFAEAGFSREDIFGATQEITDKIDEYPYYENLDLLPVPAIGKNDPAGTLKRLVREGLKERGVFDNEEYKQRAKEELKIIEDKNFVNYFLIVGDLVRWAKRNSIRVGPGRGSAAGSLICYALGITDVDPIEFDLLFFRFINPDRNDFPDIDIDFQRSRRKEVKDYLHKKYGNVANIATYAYFTDKGLYRDAARVHAVPLKEVNAAMDSITFFDDMDTSTAEPVVHFRQSYPDVIKLAKKLRGKIRGTGINAAGMVISKEPIEHYAPIETREDPQDKVSGRVPIIALNKDEVDAIGLIKLDVLGLNELDVIDDALKAIKERHGIEIELPIHKADLNDKKVLDELHGGNTVAVFQGGAAYTDILKTMKIETFEDLAASNALVRPGAKNTVGKIYLDRQYGRQPVKYLHDSLKPFLERTYGTIIYQEQVMQTAVTLGGLSMSEADKMRKIIGKKRDPAEFAVFKDKFVTGASQHVHEVAAEELFHDFEAHAGYSFNRSHAVAYSLMTYWTAMLKVYYPLEYLWAALKNEGDDKKRTELLIEAKRRSLRVLLPHINKSAPGFTLEDDAIRFGLVSIKGIGDKAAENLLKSRPFKNYEQLKEIALRKYSGINTRMVSSLNAIGAANFPDNPLKGNESDNYYEYLNIPKFDVFDMPEKVMRHVVPLSEYDEEATFVVNGMVEKIKRGDGWSRVEVVDETGKAGIFHDEDTEIEKGQLYFMLVAGNRIMRYVPAEDVAAAGKLSNIEDPFLRLLWDDNLPLVPGASKYAVCYQPRKTKAGKLMATLVLANEKREMRKVLIFPKQFKQFYGKITEGDFVSVRLRKLDDGAYMLTGVD